MNDLEVSSGGTPNGSPRVENAIETMALAVLAKLAKRAEDEWECWPEIGEHDWTRVVEVVSRLAPLPMGHELVAAYALLEQRAEAKS